MVKSKCDIISELQEDLAAAKLHEINQNNKIVDLENQLRQLQDQVDLNVFPDTRGGPPQEWTAPSRASSRQSSRPSSQSTMSGESTSVASYNMGAEPVSDNRVHDMFTVFREVFKAQSVANVTKYNGKNSLMEFLRALEIKFPPAVWTNADRRDILVNHLEGTALSIFKGLPPGVREGTYEGVVSALKAARRNPCEQLRNVREWEHLSKKSNESVVDFCCRMEDLSRRIHPSTEWDFIRGSKLYSCLQHWQNSYYMLEALDAPEGQVYEEVKKVATRLEKLQFDSASHLSSSYRERGRSADRKSVGCEALTQQQIVGKERSPNAHFNVDVIMVDAITERPGGISLSSELEGWCKTVRKRSNSTQPLAMGQPCTYDVKIFGIPVKALIDTGSVVSIIPQQIVGKERSPNAHFNVDVIMVDAITERPGGISLSSELEGWCKTVRKRSNSTQPLAMGQPCTYDVKIFGIPVKALIDTGSVVSIIPVGLLKQARGQGVDLDSEARIVGDGKQRKLFDASGNAMSFLSEIVTEVTVIGASTACVHMHVQQSKDNTLLLEALTPNGHQNMGYATNSRFENGLPPDTAFAEGRVVVAPGTVATVKINGGTRMGACMFWSQNPQIESGVCQINRGKTEISVVNRGNESWVINRGENLGEFSSDTWVDPRVADIPGDMLCLHQLPAPQAAERIDLLLSILDTNRKAGPMPDE
ncbi:hypothetical protein COOONC_03436, partial [Cooperia oncophora]